MIDEKIKKLNFSVISEKHLHGICLQNRPKMFSEAQTIFLSRFKTIFKLY